MTKNTQRPSTPLGASVPRWKPVLVACGMAVLPLCLTVSCASSNAEDAPHGGSSQSSGSSKTLDPAFVARAETVCRPYMKYNSTHFFRMEGFNRFDPSPALLDKVAVYLSRNPSYRTLASDLDKLGQPDSGASAWQNVMGDIASSQQLMRNEIRSAHQGDVAAFKTYDERLTASDAGLHADLVELGLTQGSACYGVQGDPFETAPRSE
jgi:hypothetical protein